MEFRKEKNEKTKELIRKHCASDIFNISSGYYKTENIFPISSKPNEKRQKKIEFIPKYKELKHYERLFNDLLSDEQKHNSNITNLKPNQSHKNFELEIIRNRSKKVKKNCFDKNGNLSAKKMYFYDVFGKEDTNNSKNVENNENLNKRELNNSKSKSIKEKRKKKNKFLFNKKKYNQKKLHKNLDINIINNNDKIHNIKYTYNKYYNNSNYNNNANNNIKAINNENENFNIINWTINPYNKSTNVSIDKKKSSQQKLQKYKSETKFYGHPKEITKLFYTETKEPIIKKNNIVKINKNDNKEQQYFNILIQNNDLNNNDFSVDDQKIKEIFYKNGLHIYDFNEDGMNGLFIKKKMEAKLRKDKNDDNFDKNFRKVIKELDKYNIKIDKKEMKDGKGFKYENGIKKRKGTPGKALYNNIDKKDYNTKLNTGFSLK